MCICATLFSSRSSPSSSSLSSSGGNCWIFDLLRFDSTRFSFFFFNSSSCQIPLTKKNRDHHHHVDASKPSKSSVFRVSGVDCVRAGGGRVVFLVFRCACLFGVSLRVSSPFFRQKETFVFFPSMMMMMMMMSNRQTSVFPRRTPCPQNADPRDVPSSFLCLF